jgi:hypothetical protein
MPDIIWKPIKNYENYHVSTSGDIKNAKTQRILKYYIRNGYKSITLCKNNCKKTFNIHTIVADTFLINNIKDKYVVHHKNENKLDNTVDNLEFTTYAYNTAYSMSKIRNKNNDTVDMSLLVDIPNYSNYKISNSGDIYSKTIKRFVRIITLPSGYKKIKLKSDNNTYKDVYVHVLVAMAYLGYIPSTSSIVINHIDGNKQNNNVTNLEIVTHKQNMKHSVILNKEKLFRKRVYYYKNNEQIIYNSIKEATLDTGIDSSSIVKSCKYNKLAGNIKWWYI